MPSVADLVDDQALQSLAQRDVVERGLALADGGRVRLGVFGPLGVTATVEEEHEVELRSSGQGDLAWSCTCASGQTGVFCEHAVAAGSRRGAARRRGGDRRGTATTTTSPPKSGDVGAWPLATARGDVARRPSSPYEAAP